VSKRTAIAIRFEIEQREDLDRAAAEERRSLSDLIRIIIADWLAERNTEQPRRAA
jgi:hypothetical protein